MKKGVTNSIGVMILTGISQVLGYIREVLFAFYLGTSMQLEAFQMAETVPMLFTQILISAVPLALTPLLVKEREKNQGNSLINNAIIMFTGIMFAIMLFILFRTEWFVGIIAPGFEGEKLYLTCRLTTILAPNILLLSMAAIFNSYLSAQEEFILPTTIYLILNIFIVLAQIITRADVEYVATASLSASIIVFILLFLFVKVKYGFKIEWKLISREKMLVIGKSILPVCVISMFSSLNLVLDKFFASMCGEGSVVIFSYSYKVINLPVFLFTMSVTKVMLPSVTRQIEKKETEDLTLTLKRIFVLCIGVGISIAVFLLFGSEFIVKLLFGRGAFTQQDILRTAQCLKTISFGIAGMALSTFCQSISYAFGDYFEPFKVLFSQIIVYLGIVILTEKSLGVAGIALANVLAYTFAVLIWINLLRKKYQISLLRCKAKEKIDDNNKI